MGLFISQAMARQHGGELNATSLGVGSGSTFTLLLPLYHVPEDEQCSAIKNPEYSETFSIRSPRPQVPSVAFRASSASSLSLLPTLNQTCLRILIVDDVKSNRKLLSRLALNRHHRVDEAVNGSDAVVKVKTAMDEQDPYDSILMDYEMPIMKGPAAVLEIRQLQCNAFIVGVTGNVLEEDVAQFMSSGANFVLAKPVKFKLLEDLWREHGVLLLSDDKNKNNNNNEPPARGDDFQQSE